MPALRTGRVGRAHGLDGSFYLDSAAEPLTVGDPVRVGALDTLVERLGGTARRPLLKLRDVSSREAADSIRGEDILVERDLEPDEYLAADLVGLRIAGLGTVRRIINAPSCDLLAVGDDEILIPFIRDAVKRIDVDAGVIEIDPSFLALE